MTFWIILIVCTLLFVLGWFITKSGRLTVYMASLDGVLIASEPIMTSLLNVDYSAFLSQREYGILTLILTGMTALSRKRREIRDVTV